MTSAVTPHLTLTSERYTSRDFFAREWETAWTKNWLILCRADELPEPGDFTVEEIGPESIIAMRQNDGSIRCFYNVCQHRGNRLVLSSEGSLPAFTCGYHGWRYALDGACIEAQDAEDFPVDPCKHVRLTEIRSELFGGFIWINMDDDAIALRDYLGPVWDQWQAYPTDKYVRISATSVRMPCNWKTAMDNFHESYHVAVAHAIGLHWMEEHYPHTVTTQYGNGHAVSINHGSVQARRLPEGTPLGIQITSELEAWGLNPDDFKGRERDTRLALQRQKRAQAESRGFHHYAKLADDQLTDPYHYTVFPNSALTFNPDGVLLLRATPHPEDPNQCILDTWFYTVGEGSFWAKMLTNGAETCATTHAPRELVDYGTHNLGPVLNDDAWVLEAQQKGFLSRGYRGALLAGQESRIAQYHAMIDHCMAGGRAANLNEGLKDAAE